MLIIDSSFEYKTRQNVIFLYHDFSLPPLIEPLRQPLTTKTQGAHSTTTPSHTTPMAPPVKGKITSQAQPAYSATPSSLGSTPSSKSSSCLVGKRSQ